MNQYLINLYCNDDSKIKLKPIKNDRVAFERLFKNEEFIENSNVTVNYEYFHDRILEEEISIEQLYSAIERLMIVEIELKNGEDDPQLIFESLNSTGLDLNDADKVRNFILMGQTATKQEHLYNNYWNKVEKNTDYNVSQFIRDYMTMNENKIANVNKIYVSFKNYIIEKHIEIEDCLKEMLKYSVYYSEILKCKLDIKEADQILRRINNLEVTVAYPFFLGLLDDYYSNIINKEQLIDVLRIIEAYVFRRIVCKIPTSSLNKIFMNLQKEIKSNENYKEDYVEILKFILNAKRASQRFPNDEEFKRGFFETDFYNMKSKNKLYLLERLENFNNCEKVDVENLINSNELTIEHIMPQTLTQSWKGALGEKYNEIYEKYLNTIGNLTLTGYNSSLSNKGFIEKRDMEKGFKQSRLRLNKYISQLELWDEENIIKRTEELYYLALQIWSYTKSTFNKTLDNDNLFSLNDEDDFTNTKIKKFKFMGEEVKTTNWTALYEYVCSTLYDIDPVPFIKLTTKNFDNEYINKRFSNKKVGIRTPFEIDNNVYIEKNLNTEAKLNTLRIVFDEYNLDYNELLFNIC